MVQGGNLKATGELIGHPGGGGGGGFRTGCSFEIRSIGAGCENFEGSQGKL